MFRKTTKTLNDYHKKQRVKKSTVTGLSFALILALLIGSMGLGLPSSAMDPSRQGAGQETSERAISQESNTDVADTTDSAVDSQNPEPKTDNTTDQSKDKVKTQGQEETENKKGAKSGTPYDLNASWRNDGQSTSSLIMYPDNTGYYRVDLKNVNESASNESKLVISYRAIDPTDSTMGIDLKSYSDVDDDNKDILKKVVHDEANKTLTYVFDEEPFSAFSTNIIFTADGKLIYPGEKIEIESAYYMDDELKSSTVKGDATAKIESQIGTSDYVLLNPRVMKEDKGSGEIYQTVNNLGQDKPPAKNWTTTIDFSKLEIYAKGMTKTYQDWLKWADENTTEPPIKFYMGNTATHTELKTNSSGYKTIATYSNSATVRAFRNPIYYETSSNFVKKGDTLPYISVGKNGQPKTTITYQINGRGPVETMKWYDAKPETAIPESPSISCYNTAKTIKATSDNIAFSLHTGTGYGGNIGYIQPNSSQYKDTDKDFMYHQHLFSVSVTGGSEESVSGQSVEMKVDVPQGVALTHLLVPQKYYKDSNKNGQYASFDYVKVKGQDKEYKYGDVIKFDNPITDSVTLEIQSLAYANYFDGRPSELIDGTKFKFVGITSGLTQNSKIDFKVTMENTQKNISCKVAYDGKVTWDAKVLEGASALLYKKIDGDLVKADASMAKGSKFYVRTFMSAADYPYSTATYLDHGLTSGVPKQPLFQNPVAYISVPPGMIAGDVVLSGNTKSIDGKDLEYTKTVFEKAGKWGNVGGSLVEIKFHGPNGDDVWISDVTYGTNKKAFLTANVEIEIPDSFDDIKYGGNYSYTDAEVAWNTWSNMTDSSTEGIRVSSAARNFILSLPSQAVAKSKNSVRKGANLNQDLSIAEPINSVRNNGAVKIKNEVYRSYNENDAGSYPERPAGSQNEEFRYNMAYNKANSVTNGKTYFLLPENDNWRPELNRKPITYYKNIASDTGIKMYFTTTVGVVDKSMNKTTGEYDDVSWIQFSVDDLTPTILENITGFKYEFSELKPGMGFSMYLPFSLPKVNSSANIDYDDIAVGDVTYWFSSTDNGPGGVPALKLRQSDKPVIVELNGTTEEAISAETSEHQFGSADSGLAKWYEAVTYDDQTADVAISSMAIEYTPQGSSNTQTWTIGYNDFKRTVYTPNKDPLKGDVYENGYKNSIDFGKINKAASDYISTGKPGKYKITYITTDDHDVQSVKAVRNINVIKTLGNSIQINQSSEMHFYDEKLENLTSDPSIKSWEDYFLNKLSVTDSGIKIDPVKNKEQFKLTAINDLMDSNKNISNPSEEDIKKASENPGKYRFVYSYSDKYGLNQNDIVLNVTVKFRTSINVVVTSSGIGVSGAALSDDQNSNLETNEHGIAKYSVEASDNDVTSVDYELSLNSVPKGLKLPEGQNNKKSGTLNKDNKEDIIFQTEPVRINAVLQGNDDEKWIKSVSLYKKSVPSDQLIYTYEDIQTKGSITFDPSKLLEDGSKWFDGNYYMTAQPEIGFRAADNTDFKNGSEAFVKTLDISVKNEDISKTAVPFKIPRYTLNYEMNDDGDSANSIFASESGILEGSTVASITKNPTREGYIFDGWYKTAVTPSNPVNGQKWSFDVDKITTDTSIYAGWKTYDYKVAFYGNGGVLDNSLNVKNVSVTSPEIRVGNKMPKDPTRTGYTFNGWNTSLYGNGQKFDSTTKINGNINVYATWKINSYNLSFDLNGGDSSRTPSQKINYNQLAKEVNSPSRTGYTFKGWNTKKDGSGTLWNFKTNKMPAGKVRLYAQWSINSYDLSFDINGGTSGKVSNQKVNYNDLAKQVNDPSRSGYTFTGWTAKKDGSVSVWKFNSTKMPAKDVTLYAQWKNDSTDNQSTTTKPDPDKPDTPDIPDDKPNMVPKNNKDDITTPPASTDGNRMEQEGGQENIGAPAQNDVKEEAKKIVEQEGIPSIKIGDSVLPLFGTKSFENWSLVNLIMIIIGAVLAVLGFFSRRKESEHVYGLGKWSVVSIVMAAVGICVFAVTQNLNGLMSLIDIWTILNGTILAGGLFSYYKTRIGSDEAQGTRRE